MGDFEGLTPEVTDQDIRWACGLLGLPDDAFHGKDGTDARKAVLQSWGPIDVAACPGSGKTTLLVAKLAIIAKNWQHRTRGVCVLSHTNAARREIENKLGHTAVGRRLLSYPHFIGTIQRFVDEFLAIPWLRSRGIPITMIDDEGVERRRRAILASQHPESALRQYVQNREAHTNLVGQWVIASPEFEVQKAKKTPAFETPGPAAKQLTRLVEIVFRDGYHRFGEMFLWAGVLMDEVPNVIDILRDRFPLLFVDEAQDNREAQSAILHRIFMAGDAPVRRQRFGDGNQAIFEANDTTEVTKYKFPDDDTPKMDLPNSHRFGPKLARLAGPLGISQYEGGLIGQCPSTRLVSRSQEGAHTVFLFDDPSANRVLDAYGALLLKTFSEQELHDGTFTAVGQIHKLKGDDHKPRHVGHYWADYDPELSKTDPKPQTFVQYVFAGLKEAETSGQTFPVVEKIAEGILLLAGMTKRRTPFRHRRRSHGFVLQLLEEKTALQGCYKLLVYRLAVRREALTRDAWDDSSRGVVQEIAEGIAGGSLANSEAGVFLAWKDEADSNSPAPTIRRRPDNIYRYSKDGQNVHIRVGSIHSVKGETHTATLVLETFWQGKKGRHNLEHLLPWLTGSKLGADTGVHQNYRLKLHYVAMTRPTHLLCLAINQNSGGESKEKLIDDLKNHGWDVKSVR